MAFGIKMKTLFRLFKNTIFLVWFIGALITFSITASIYAVNMAITASKLTATAATTAIKHKKEMSKAIAKVKAKARMKRIVVAVPLAGLVAGGYFEEQDYQEWLEENPEGSRSEYLCEVADVTAEILDEWVTTLPDYVQKYAYKADNLVPECEEA